MSAVDPPSVEPLAVTDSPVATNAEAAAPRVDPDTEEVLADDSGEPWLRLDARMIWADAVRVLLSLAPAGVALLIVGVDPDPGVLWPVIGIAVWGVIGAWMDVLRWITTRYRVTATHLERRTGLLFRTYRSVRRERVRSVDADARLLQRLVGLRRVRVGAGQMNTAMESALLLDAVSRNAALDLHNRLLGDGRQAASSSTEAVEAGTPEARQVPGAPEATSANGGARPAEAPSTDATGQVPGSNPAKQPATNQSQEQEFTGLRWWWVWYNMFNIWAFFMAAGLLWGSWVMLGMFGFDAHGWLSGLADWESFGTGPTVAVAVAATWILGSLGMGVNFFTEHWNFRLIRVPGENGTLLRTEQGLFRTREVNRDDNRLRGITIAEPLLWRWIRMADTSVITTGLSIWSASATVLPRGPRSVARQVTRAVLETDDNPLEAPLRHHPRAALRRRAVWALGTTGAITGLLGWLAATTSLPWLVVTVAGTVLLAASLGLAWAGYRSLGHTLTEDYLVVRSGALSRSTSALQRRAVSGVRIKQSLLQRRLGLATVSVSTAAGWGGYEALDVAVEESADLADRALPLGVNAFRAAPQRPPVEAAARGDGLHQSASPASRSGATEKPG